MRMAVKSMLDSEISHRKATHISVHAIRVHGLEWYSKSAVVTVCTHDINCYSIEVS